MLVISCIDGILSNFQFYNAQMMQGVRSIFQAACGKNNSANATGDNNKQTNKKLIIISLIIIKIKLIYIDMNI